MGSCAAGQTSTGTPFPRAIEAKVVTGVSSIPRAILEMVLAVQGATSRRSACSGDSPSSLTCSAFPVSSRMTGFPVAHSRRSARIELLGRGRHHSGDVGPVPDQLPCQLRYLDRGDASGHSEHYPLALQLPASRRPYLLEWVPLGHLYLPDQPCFEISSATIAVDRRKRQHISRQPINNIETSIDSMDTRKVLEMGGGTVLISLPKSLGEEERRSQGRVGAGRGDVPEQAHGQPDRHGSRTEDRRR